MYEEYLDLSMTGASTIQPNDVRSLLRSFVVPFNDYEAQCRFRNDLDKMQFESVDRHWRKCVLDYLVIGACLGLAMSFSKFFNRSDRFFETYHSQRLLGFIVSKYLDRLDDRSYSLPSLDPPEQLLVLSAVRIAGTMYRVSGRRGEAISLLETVIHLVEQDLDLKNAIIWFLYNEMLLELAHCCAEEGHRDEAIHVLTKPLIVVPNVEETIANMRRSRHFGVVYLTFLKRGLRNYREDALQFVGRLKDGRADTHSTQEHHARLQEGSCQPEISDWGPFLTDCIEWDEI